MAVVQPPERLAELEHSEEILLQELQRVDEILLEELEHVDEMLLRIAAAIDQLPDRVVSAIGRDQHGSLSGNGTRAAEPARSRASTRPFDPYGEDEVEVEAAEVKESAAGQLVRKLRNWVRAS
jgi:hypothetical protein